MARQALRVEAFGSLTLKQESVIAIEAEYGCILSNRCMDNMVFFTQLKNVAGREKETSATGSFLVVVHVPH